MDTGRGEGKLDICPLPSPWIKKSNLKKKKGNIPNINNKV
jgi:hypothetical protein